MNGIFQWLGQNYAFTLALFSLFGTIVTGFIGWRQRKEVSGDREADQEEEIRNELRAENKDFRAQIKTQNAEIDVLKEQNDELKRQNERLQTLLDQSEKRNKELTERNSALEVEMGKLKVDVFRLTRKVTELETAGRNA